MPDFDGPRDFLAALRRAWSSATTSTPRGRGGHASCRPRPPAERPDPHAHLPRHHPRHHPGPHRVPAHLVERAPHLRAVALRLARLRRRQEPRQGVRRRPPPRHAGRRRRLLPARPEGVRPRRRPGGSSTATSRPRPRAGWRGCCCCRRCRRRSPAPSFESFIDEKLGTHPAHRRVQHRLRRCCCTGPTTCRPSEASTTTRSRDSLIIGAAQVLVAQPRHLALGHHDHRRPLAAVQPRQPRRASRS